MIAMRVLLFSFLLIMGAGACQGQAQNSGNPAASVKVLPVAAFKSKIADKSVQLIDVRTPEEFAQGHIQGAKNINVLSGDFSAKASSALSKDKPVALYCRTGKRSQRASAMLTSMGYKVIYDLQGGFMAWSAQQ